MTKKNTLIMLGSIAAVSVPMVAVVSCGTNTPSKVTVDNKYLLESQDTMDRVQLEYWKEVMTNPKGLGMTVNLNDLLNTTEIKESFDFVIRQHVMQDKQYLQNVAGSMMTTQAMQDEAKKASKTPYELANSWKLLELRENGDLTTTPIDADAKKFIMQNNNSIKSEVIKHAIATKYLLTAMTKDVYKETFMESDDTFTEVQKLINPSDFNLVNEGIKQHLFASWTVSLDSAASSQYIGVTTTSGAEADIDTLITGSGKFATDTKYSTKNKKLLDGLLVNSHKDVVGFDGIKAISGSRGVMKMDKDGLKAATTAANWSGYLVDGVLTQSSIPYFKKGENQVSVNKVIGLMPVWDGTKLIYKEDVITKKNLAMLLSMSNSVYSNAEKYFTTRKADAIKLKISSPELKEVAINHGFTFIEE